MRYTYELTFSRRSYMPDKITVAYDRNEAARQIEQHVLDRRRSSTSTPVYVDVMTDQINVYAARELIAVYMA